jgi:outer membrane protein assembly factor BamB
MNSPGKYPSIGWEWEPDAREDRNQIEGPAGDRYEFEAGPEPRVTRTAPTGWSTAVPHQPSLEAAMVADENRIYVALYSGASTGCRVVALDAHTGAIVWHTELIGLGSVGHSKYANRVQIWLGANRLTVHGNESAGRYTEIFDPANGSRLNHEAVHD